VFQFTIAGVADSIPANTGGGIVRRLRSGKHGTLACFGEGAWSNRSKGVFLVIATDSRHAMTTLGIVAALVATAAFAIAAIAMWGTGTFKRPSRTAK
jgi:hypothetical protein